MYSTERMRLVITSFHGAAVTLKLQIQVSESTMWLKHLTAFGFVQPEINSSK